MCFEYFTVVQTCYTWLGGVIPRPCTRHTSALTPKDVSVVQRVMQLYLRVGMFDRLQAIVLGGEDTGRAPAKHPATTGGELRLD